MGRGDTEVDVDAGAGVESDEEDGEEGVGG